MSNSGLVDFVRLSPNYDSPRQHSIDTITIHHAVGQCSVETLGAIFASRDREASSNYGIGSDGRIGLYVDENNRSWCSGNADNDNRAITIEVADNSTYPYEVNACAYKSLVNLCADICKRNSIPKLLWIDDKSLIGQTDKQNMTVHKWFQATACPGEWLFTHMGVIADDVNNLIIPNAKPKTIYRVQVGAFAQKQNATTLKYVLEAQGFKSIIVPVEKGNQLLYRVQVGAFAIKQNAENMKQRLIEMGYSPFIYEIAKE